MQHESMSNDYISLFQVKTSSLIMKFSPLKSLHFTLFFNVRPSLNCYNWRQNKSFAIQSDGMQIIRLELKIIKLNIMLPIMFLYIFKFIFILVSSMEHSATVGDH